MNRHVVIATSTLVAGAVAVAVILRPAGTIAPGPELGVPAHIPSSARAVIRTKMLRHGEQLTALMAHVVALDYDGAARAGGAVFDEPALARPITGDELNGVLPERFFELQDALRVQARQLVEAAARHDGPRLAESFAALTKSCVSCHDVYLHGGGRTVPPPAK